jgi:hypothetical membrane protein
MEDLGLTRIIQIIFGVVLIIEALYKPGIIRRLIKSSSHKVNRLLYLAGGIILLLLGIFGKLPRI